MLTSWLEGFAKLHSFKMRGSEVLYSGAMLRSPNYVASVEAGELVPMITLNKFNTEEEEWSWWESLQILVKTFQMEEGGNNNPALWRIGPEDEGVYLAVTDAKVATRYDHSFEGRCQLHNCCTCLQHSSKDKESYLLLQVQYI